MMPLRKEILSTLLFYNLLDYPLTSSEIFRYLFCIGSEKKRIRLSDIIKNIPQKVFSNNGFYFFEGKENLIRQRLKREKIAAQKWKKVKKICALLQMIPFIRGVGISGSLTFYNTRPESDFDLLVITKAGRIWATRALISIFLSLIGQKRYGAKTKNKICLNCFLTEESLEIKPEIEPRNFYSIQEYARIIPIFEAEKWLWQKFKSANKWLGQYLFFYPWFDPIFYQIAANPIFKFIRTTGEKLFDGMGDSIENLLKREQIKRIKKNPTNNPDDQIFFSDQYLFFHPHAKSIRLQAEYNQAVSHQT